MTVGLDRRSHVDGAAEIRSLELKSRAVIPEARLCKYLIYSLPSVVAYLTHDVCRDTYLYTVKLGALQKLVQSV